MSAYTPGEWVICPTTEGLHIVRAQTKHNPDGMIICAVGYGSTNEINEANGRLIVAAPDLLAALIGLMNHFDKASFDNAFSDANAAIAKAIGPSYTP